MTTTITRLYANKSDADAAIADLKDHGFSSEEIFVANPPQLTAGATAADAQGIVDDIHAKLLRGYHLRRHADVYAKKVAAGAWLVTAYAPGGSGYMATVLLDRHNPIDSGVTERVKRPPKYDEAAPVSSAFWMPVHAADPTPFATFWNVPTLVKERAPLSAWLGYSTHGGSSAPLSALFRLPVTLDKKSSSRVPLA